MELDNLKELWQQLDTEKIHGDEQEITRIIQQRSQSPVAKMKRNLLIELIVVIVLYSIAIWNFMSTSMGRYSEIAILLLFVGLLFLFYYYKKNRLLKQMQCVTCEVRSNLQRQLTTLEKYVQFYFVCGTILTPVAYFASGAIVMLNYPNEAVASGFTASRSYILFIAIGLLITIGSYFLNKWYIRKLYGQHIKRLRILLHQMEESEQIL
jgi:hypothetical protein